jgi:predicted nucleic acid-binding Zn ribbon protein
MRSHERRSPVTLRHALEQMLERLGIGDRVRDYEAVAVWSEVVGERIAEVSRAVRIRRGVLVVEVGSGPWRQELSMRKADILAKLNTRLGSATVKDIQFL